MTPANPPVSLEYLGAAIHQLQSEVRSMRAILDTIGRMGSRPMPPVHHPARLVPLASAADEVLAKARLAFLLRHLSTAQSGETSHDPV